MAIHSMTGYASAQAPLAAPDATAPEPGMRLGLDMRSVNSRFLDLSFRLPEEWRAHEGALRELLTSQLQRGKVEVRASFELEAEAGPASPSPRQLQRLQSLQDSVLAWLPHAPPLSVADVLRLGHSQTRTPEDVGPALLALAQTVLKGLMQARAREGARLAQTLLERTAQLRALAQQARPLIPQLVEQQRQKFLERWREAMALGADTVLPEAAQDRALSEATAFAIRIDVAEELTRLAAHLDEIEDLLSPAGKPRSVGKRLDFLIQELHREANTLGAKSALLELTRISIDMKVLIEQMREQVQNLE
jgi:uncharacterized protein (TIGR00255 family)